MRIKHLIYTLLILTVLVTGGIFWTGHKKSTFQAVIPVTFSSSELPVFNIAIDQNLYAVELDLGSAMSLVLKEQDLNQIKKQEDGIQKWSGIKGDCYTSRAFIVPQIAIKNLIFKNLRVIEHTIETENSAVLLGPPCSEKLSGIFGREALEDHLLFLDFPNNRMILCDNNQFLTDQGVLLNEYIKAPFILDKMGILFEVETDFGTQTFLLDTGSTLNMISDESVKHLEWRRDSTDTFGVGETEKFMIGGKNFGKTDLVSYKIHTCNKYEGILGMEFLREHPVYIDFPGKALYFR